jgi:pyridoxal phosphate enzyme (YggS family)
VNLEAEVRERLERLGERIERAAQRAGRDPREIRVVGISKRQPPERIVAAVRAGLREFGESYVQEARAKLPRLQALLGESEQRRLRWHLVGRLQRNKAREASRWFEVVHSVDRPELAAELDRRATGWGRTLEVLLQVNLSGESQKGGVAPPELPGLLASCGPLTSLRVVGLMVVPRESANPEASRAAFASLRQLRDTLRATPGGSALRELSMGMSADFEVAIEEGASVVRVGTAIFGPREG